MKWQFIKKCNGRGYEGTIYFKITFKKKEEEKKTKKVNLIHIRKKKVELKESQS